MLTVLSPGSRARRGPSQPIGQPQLLRPMTHPDTRQSPEQIASLCLALSNPARVQIVRLLLREGEMLVKELMEELHQSQTFVSRHLELLRRQEVVHFRKEGRLHGKNANYVYYSVRPDKMEWLKKVVL